MTLFEHLNMKEKIENELGYSLSKNDLTIATKAFNVTYFLQENNVKNSIITNIFNECKKIFGNIVELNDNKIILDMPTNIRSDDVFRVAFYSLYISISCYHNLTFTIRDCSTPSITDIFMNDYNNEYIENHFKGKISDEFIKGLIKILDIVKAYDDMLKYIKNFKSRFYLILRRLNMEVVITNRQGVESTVPYNHKIHSRWTPCTKIGFLGQDCLIESIRGEVGNFFNPILGYEQRKEFWKVEVCTEEEYFKSNYILFGEPISVIEQELNKLGYKIVKS